MSAICKARLAEERKQWRRDHPYGFYARPTKNADSSLNMMIWDIGIPGKENLKLTNGNFSTSMILHNRLPIEATEMSESIYISFFSNTHLRDGIEWKLMLQNFVSDERMFKFIINVSERENHSGKFTPPIFHPNVFPSGTVCLSILNEEKSWKPAITLKQIVLGIQDLMNDPNNADPAQLDAFSLFKNNRGAYDAKIKEQAKSMAA
ncbi:hypothetical protein PSTT_10169 [Puccinia striiformis]|uniref:UBC core domain-containing protein n=1 Tax=Puccinia striiformis TaxID=27350 RepID=A0A2S4V5J2_9BASI|nr:hypothetical protein PSTT_10169 [Puccinia striiformis]